MREARRIGRRRTKRESPFACVMDAIDPSARGPHLENAKRLFASVTKVTELAGGYSFRLPANFFLDAARFVELERLCCPFFRFVIEVEAEDGQVVLQLTGREGVKDFIKAEVTEMVGQWPSSLECGGPAPL